MMHRAPRKFASDSALIHSQTAAAFQSLSAFVFCKLEGAPSGCTWSSSVLMEHLTGSDLETDITAYGK
jgi:hypothetical protein